MKKTILTLALCLAFAGLAQAQLSEGETYSSKIVTGNRPEAGDWGLYFGPSLSEIRDIADSKVEFQGLPLINLKYYISDRYEYRLGVQYSNRGSKNNGKYEQDFIVGENETTQTIPFTNNSISRRLRLSPGIAYHFSPKNILDVYMGFSIPLGFDAQKSIIETENPTVSNGVLISQKYINNTSYNSFVVGVNAFIGLQAFVADLPVAIGFEYGLSGLLRTNDRIRHERTDADGNLQTFYTLTNDYYSTEYTELNCKSMYLDNDFRFTITYFFNNK